MTRSSRNRQLSGYCNDKYRLIPGNIQARRKSCGLDIAKSVFQPRFQIGENSQAQNRRGRDRHDHDGLPLIGQVPQIEGAYVATGHSVWGILNAPATGEALAELIAEGGARSTDLRPFDPARLRPLNRYCAHVKLSREVAGQREELCSSTSPLLLHQLDNLAALAPALCAKAVIR